MRKEKLTRWVSHMWTIMGHTGNGYARPSTKHSGKGVDRRNDKLRETYAIDEDNKPTTIMVERNESKLQRKFRTAVPIFMKKSRA